MTNVEIRRNVEIRMTKPATAQLRVFRHSGFGFLSSFVIRHSTICASRVHGPNACETTKGGSSSLRFVVHPAVCLAVSMQSEAPLTLILSPLRAGRGELERTCLGSLFGDPDTVPPKVSFSLRKSERDSVRVRLDCMDTAKRSRRGGGRVHASPGQLRF